jgi:hypothetical protein
LSYAMADRSTKIVVWGIELLPFLWISYVAVDNLISARRLADYSAHAALTKEIYRLLEEIPRGQPYPKSLSELDLTFPDGATSRS